MPGTDSAHDPVEGDRLAIDPLAGLNRRQRAPAAIHFVGSALAGVVVCCALATTIGWAAAGLAGWTAGSAVFVAWTWSAIWPLDAETTARLAQREDPGRAVRDLVVLTMSVATLLIVALVLFRATQTGLRSSLLGATCIAGSWLVLHTIFTLRYARLYYSDPVGGIEVPGETHPAYRDFAYLAFTVGMTFQVSDTEISQSGIRSTVLRQALLSFVFNTVIIAVTINLLAGLGH